MSANHCKQNLPASVDKLITDTVLQLYGIQSCIEKESWNVNFISIIQAWILQKTSIGWSLFKWIIWITKWNSCTVSLFRWKISSVSNFQIESKTAKKKMLAKLLSSVKIDLFFLSFFRKMAKWFINFQCMSTEWKNVYSTWRLPKRLTLFSPHKWSFICCKNPKFSLETAFTLENWIHEKNIT